MTVIAWDGKSIAADRLAVMEGLRRTTSKLHRFNGRVLTFAGEQATGLALVRWYKDGADPAKYPERQKTDDWTRLIVASAGGVEHFERQPFPIRVEDPFSAWGSGRDFALASMYLGRSAEEAVRVACEFDTGCGGGVDVFNLKEL